ncbi:MAG: hypothetical protein ING39_13320 [Burkholderiales bacterium]|nr:hypothetical protein [Burkholderiales bacterium]
MTRNPTQSLHPRLHRPAARLRLLALFGLLAVGLAACGGSGSSPPPPPAPPPAASGVIGAAGGTLTGPDGVQLVVPAGAVSADTTFRIARSSAGAPALPPEVRPDVPIYEVTPHGQQFLRPVQLRLPLTEPAQSDAVVLVSSPTEPWFVASDAQFEGRTAVMSLTSLSWFSPFSAFDLVCSPRQGDPFPCVLPGVAPGVITTTPAGAITPAAGVTDVPTITRAATLNLSITYGGARDCSNARLRLLRSGPTAAPAVVLIDQAVPMTPSSGSNTRSGGALAYQAPVDASLNGFISYQLDFACTRAFDNRRTGTFSSGSYRVAIANTAPTISQAPSAQTITAGGGATFTVAATGTPAPTYAWTLNGSAVGSGAFTVGACTGNASTSNGGASLSLTSVSVGCNGATIGVTASNGVNPNATATTTLTVNGSAPAITQALLAQTITAGAGATYTTAASGNPAPDFTWRLNGTQLGNSTFTIGSCTGASAITAGGTNLSLTNVALGCNGATVSVVATNVVGTSSPSSAALNVNAAGTAPTITTQPVGLTVANGGGGPFSLIANGTPTPTVTWRIDSTALSSSGAYNVGGCSFSYTTVSSGQQLNLSGVTLGCSGSQFSALVSNSAGSATSNTVALTVLNVAPPTITVPPVAASTTVGGSAGFSVTATGSAPLSYVWTLNGAALPASGGFSNNGCTATLSSSGGGASITLSNLSAACNNAAIVVTVSNGNPPDATSAPVTLSVLSAPSSLGACFGGPLGWCYLQPVPMANTLTGLAFDAVGDGVTIVGSSGTVLRSTDRLAAVSTSWLVPRYAFSGLVSPSPGRLLAAVAFTVDGGLYLSTDSGVSWTQTIALPFNAPAGIAFKDAQVGVAVGRGFIVRTSDGGSTWTRLDVPAIDTSTEVSPSGVAYAGRDVAGNDVFVASGFQSSAGAPFGGLRSTDGGLTWSVVPAMAVASRRLTDVVFNGQGVGLAMMDEVQPVAARSTDFGVTWTSVNLPFRARRAAFGGANTVVILGESSEHAHSADGGQTWSPQARSLRMGQQDWRPYMRDANEGVAIGFYGAIARTLDGGASWQAVTNGNINDSVYALEANPSRTVLLGQLNNGLQRSTDGRTWTRASTSNFLSSGGGQSISWGSESVAVAATVNEGVHLTTDAGNTWRQVRPRFDTGIYTAAAMANTQTALVSGYDVVNGNVETFVERSTDGGQTWSRLAIAGLSGSGTEIYAARFVSPTLGFLGGSRGSAGTRLWRTENSGETWQQVTLPVVGTSNRTDSIQRIEPGPVGFVFLATDSALLRSEDSGTTWSRVLDSNGFGSMLDVRFNGQVGVAVGSTGGVWRSTDGGETWTRLDLPIDGTLFATAWTSDGSVLVGGGGGALLINRSQGALAARPDNPMFRQSLNLPAAPAAGTVAPPRRVGPAVRPGMPSGAHAPGSREALLLAPPTAPAAAPPFPGAAVVLPKVRTPDRRAPAPESGATAGAARASR